MWWFLNRIPCQYIYCNALLSVDGFLGGLTSIFVLVIIIFIGQQSSGATRGAHPAITLMPPSEFPNMGHLVFYYANRHSTDDLRSFCNYEGTPRKCLFIAQSPSAVILQQAAKGIVYIIILYII